MILEGNISVIEAIKEKKRLMDAGEDHSHIRPMIIVDGGAMKGAYGVGAGLALEELGFGPVFEKVVGISSGAPSAAYFLAGQTSIGSSLIYEECCTKEFLNFKNYRNIINTHFIRGVLEGKTGKKLNIDAVLNRGHRLYIGITNYETASPFLIQPEDKEELLESIRASIAIPGMVTDDIRVRGQRYLDGASALPSILKPAIEQVSSTHVLLLTNQDKHTPDIPWWEKIIIKTIFRGRFSKPLLKGANERRISRHNYLTEVLSNPPKPICVFWGDGSVGSFERDSAKIRETVERSRKWWCEILSR